MISKYDVVVGWPDHHGIRTVFHRYNPADIVGYIRSTDNPVRYFAEDRTRMPIEGTHRTRAAALAALIAYYRLSPSGHVLSISRYQRGSAPIRGAGMQYGTRGRCSCGEWQYRENTAPSRGGEAAVIAAHRTHLETLS